MIYLEHRTLFIHIPRTSGVSICRAVMESAADPEADSPNVILGGAMGPYRRHARAAELAGAIPDFGRIRKFTIVRNPWRICESMFRHFQATARRIPDFPRGERAEEFARYLRRVQRQSFSGFVVDHFHWLNGGFFRHFCCDDRGRSLGVQVLRFERLDDPTNWRRVVDWLRIRPGTDRPAANRAPRDPVRWTPQAVDFIRHRCSDDFRRFGYPRSPEA